MDDCIFCKIIKGEIPAEFEEKTDNLVVFKDAKPKAPIHLLIVPKTHIDSVLEADDSIWLETKKVALELAHKYNVSGFRVVTNAKAAAAVHHMHTHFLAEVGVDREI